MLILQRYAGQSISIGKDIEIVILGHFRGATHIGIKAPLEIKILMGEIKSKEEIKGKAIESQSGNQHG